MADWTDALVDLGTAYINRPANRPPPPATTPTAPPPLEPRKLTPRTEVQQQLLDIVTSPRTWLAGLFLGAAVYWVTHR